MLCQGSLWQLVHQSKANAQGPSMQRRGWGRSWAVLLCICVVGPNRIVLESFTLSLEATFAVIKAYHGRGLYFSSYTIQKAILMFYTSQSLFPPGLCSELPCVENWALKAGHALSRLVTLRPLGSQTGSLQCLIWELVCVLCDFLKMGRLELSPGLPDEQAHEEGRFFKAEAVART